MDQQGQETKEEEEMRFEKAFDDEVAAMYGQVIQMALNDEASTTQPKREYETPAWVKDRLSAMFSHKAFCTEKELPTHDSNACLTKSAEMCKKCKKC